MVKLQKSLNGVFLLLIEPILIAGKKGRGLLMVFYSGLM